MTWQADLADQLRSRLPTGAGLEMTGSAAVTGPLDGWSDLDLAIDLAGHSRPVGLLDGLAVWAHRQESPGRPQVVRTVLTDGRRLDLSVTGGTIALPGAASDEAVRFDAALAATKYGRGDRLIGAHLLTGILRECLVLAMRLRDRERGTTVHRFGAGERDQRADLVGELMADAGAPFDPGRPTVVERTVELYGRWRAELEPGHRSDWSGLRAVIDRGRGATT